MAPILQNLCTHCGFAWSTLRLTTHFLAPSGCLFSASQHKRWKVRDIIYYVCHMALLREAAVSTGNERGREKESDHKESRVEQGAVYERSLSLRVCLLEPLLGLLLELLICLQRADNILQRRMENGHVHCAPAGRTGGGHRGRTPLSPALV